MRRSTFKIYSLSKFQVSKTVFFTIVVRLYIRSSELTQIRTEKLYQQLPIARTPLFLLPFDVITQRLRRS